MHPEGNVYYKKTTTFTLPAITVKINVMTEDSSLTLIPEALETLVRKIDRLTGKVSTIPEEFDAMIAFIRRDDESTEAIYYLVNHTTRCVFWLDEVELSPRNIYRYYFCNTTIESKMHLRMYEIKFLVIV